MGGGVEGTGTPRWGGAACLARVPQNVGKPLNALHSPSLNASALKDSPQCPPTLTPLLSLTLWMGESQERLSSNFYLLLS